MAACLPEYLHSDSALAGDDIGVIERMHEHEVALAGQCQRAVESTVVIVPMQHDLRTKIDHRLYFDVRGGLGHHNDSRNAPAIGSKSHTLRVVSGGRTHR